MKNNTTAYFRDLNQIQKKRIEKKESNYDSRLNQGTSWWWPPYTLSETWDYLKGFITSGASSRQNPRALSGKNTSTHVVGLENAMIKHSVHTLNKPEDILVVGDVLFSKNGKTIVLGDALKERIRNAKVMILNIESPVTSDKTNTGYGRLGNILVNGFKFSLYLPDSFLKALIEDIKKENPAIEIIYDVANNHTLDASTLPYEKMTPIEKSLYDFDRVNFPLYRTIYAIRHLIDPKAKIIGAWTHELEFKSFPTQEGTRINLQTAPVTVTSLNGLTIGFMALTDILNNNYVLWKDGRAMRPEDVEGVLDAVKSHYHLDKFYILIHGGVEQNVYPSQHWQALLEQLANHCDGVIGHGSHLPGLSQVLKTANSSYVFMETSLGNFFCPTNPKNTAVSTLLTMKVTDQSIQHIEEPIEALQEQGHPEVELLSEKSKDTYLGQRWFSLHKQGFSNVPQGDGKSEKKETVQLTV